MEEGAHAGEKEASRETQPAGEGEYKGKANTNPSACLRWGLTVYKSLFPEYYLICASLTAGL